MNGWEMCGIDKAFFTREKAEQYLISEHANRYIKKYNKQVNENFWTKEKLDNMIEEVELE
jgi:hypothetical protein